MNDINPQWIWIAAVAVAAMVILLAITAGVRRARSARLREHFGSEYDRAVKATGSRTRAEDKLVSRAEEVKTFDIRPLTAAERARFTDEWKRIESRFVAQPTTAVVEADELISEVMRLRGYPMADFEKHAEYLSVKHPRVVEHYRAGHTVIDSHARGATATEDLRQAMLHYRALFEELASDGTAGDVPRTIAAEHEIPSGRLAPPRPMTAVDSADERLREERLRTADQLRDDERR